MNMTHMTSLFLSTFLLVAQAAALIGAAEPTARAGVREVVESGMQCHHIPGLSLALVSNGQVLESGGYGVKDLDTGEVVTSDTKFLVASLTKAFTATLLTHVMKQHRSNYNRQMSTNVKYVLPGVRFNNTLRSTYATLEDLLAHRMGIPRNNYVRLASDFDIHSFASKIRYLPSKGGFRDSFYYSDLLYGLSAHVTHSLQGDTPWKQQIRDVIFTPLGMANSSFVDDVDFSSDDVATPYLRENQRTVKASVDFIKHWGRNHGSGNIMSSSRDMAQWMLSLLNEGRNLRDDSPLVGEGVVENTFTAQNFLTPTSYALKYRKPRSPHSFTADNYGLGWRLGYYRGYQMVYHSGSSFGYRSYLTLLPEMQIGAVTLMSGSDPDYKLRMALHAHLMDRALDLTPWINTSNICSFPQTTQRARSADGLQDQWVDQKEEAELETLPEEGEAGMTMTHARRESGAVPSLSLQSYVGSYQHAAYGLLTVGFNATAGDLQLQYGIGQWRLTLNTGQDFSGLWLKDPPTISASFKFLTNGNSVHAVKATSFEPTLPPVFYRQ